ncbi:5'-nucleotidase /3'-nucleotidase /exopolyphosphatase [Prosthecobacter fusiformis]|uniref:5'-nucleotidase n=1 Tax=Prosthecobacter fusiformis TaxID=48464 RepID=A0A4R7S3K5_9BACT|nr:5'/3'-nucleotidase SurE [Prosthecobacter fusiformis]TDU72972.1 5'-nucleotidase /3'-nucleotidase /exopolyphosphatase [Prosthecobacter fusiformis]
MHFLLTNDDGIDAPGLKALAEAVAAVPGARVSIVAPADEQSMCGHCVTTRKPLVVEPRGEGRWAVRGPSADSVRIALFGLDLKPDWVLSGVNAGGNLGQDIVISGTVAAAREAAYHGIPAMAFSHYLVKGVAMDWPRIASWVTEIMARLSGELLHDGEYWNVNFPHHAPGLLPMPEMVRCIPERMPLDVNYEMTAEGQYQYTAQYSKRPRIPGSDVDECFGGKITVSRLKV